MSKNACVPLGTVTYKLQFLSNSSINQEILFTSLSMAEILSSVSLIIFFKDWLKYLQGVALTIETFP